MDLSCLLGLVGESGEYQDLLRRLRGPAGAHQAVALDAARPYLVASLYRDLVRPLFIIAADYEHARRIQDQLQAWCPAGTPVLFFPEYEEVTGEEEVHSEAALERLRVLSRLTGCSEEAGPATLIAPAASDADPMSTRTGG